MQRGGLRTQQQEAERTARELMDLKIEAAHLRERLRQRVGGDATAAELEAETFALQGALQEAQESLAAREQQLQALEDKYQQAMRGMLRLDEAWKSSRRQAEEAHGQLEKTRNGLRDAKERETQLEKELKASGDREETLANRVDMLEKEKRLVEQEREERAKQAQRAEIQTHELRAQLEATKQSFETQLKEQEGVTRADVKRLETKLQQAAEDAAALRGEIHARQEEATKVDAVLKDTREMEATTKRRLVKLTEEHAVLRVQLESAKQVERASVERATKTEAENVRLNKELTEMGDGLREKEQVVRSLERELVQKQKALDDEMVKKREAVEAAEQRLTMDCQAMLQAQEETWCCREKALLQEVDGYKQEIARLQAYHVDLARLLNPADTDNSDRIKCESGGSTRPPVIEPAQLRALVEQEILQRESLSTALEQANAKLASTKRQLGSRKQLELDNAKLRADYDKAKLAMERMAVRKAKSFGLSGPFPAWQSGHSSGSSETSGGKENQSSKGGSDPFTKRTLDADETGSASTNSTPRKAQRTKRVYVASRYLSNVSKR